MEIIIEKALNRDETTFIDMHSVVNIISVVQYEALKLSEYVHDEGIMKEVVDLTLKLANDIRDPDKSYLILEEVDSFIAKVYDALGTLEQKLTTSQQPYFLQVKTNLHDIFQIMKIRAQELLERRGNIQEWKAHDIAALRQNFLNVFHAIEQNSHGAYHIVYNLAEHEEGDYMINLEINSAQDETIYMPMVFQDVMRDLMANARKYTRPGGKIIAGLFQHDKHLRFVVEDNGVGIPENEILEVVKFGVRGSNVRDRATRGGGFGLTKAYYITRLFGGRMWIDSPISKDGNGTHIKIELPVPKE